MTIRASEVEIQRPCPVELPEDFRVGASTRHCGHCRKTVHLLSSLTETGATAFLAANADRDICITYLIDPRGEILFRATPLVPVSALRRPRLAAAAGLGLALAACAPHHNPRVDAGNAQEVRPVSVQEPVNPARAGAAAVVDEPSETRPVEPPFAAVAGGIGRAPWEPEPDPPTLETPKLETRAKMLAGARRPVSEMRRGGRQRQ